MWASHFLLRLAALVLTGLTLGACATQKSNEVAVGIGTAAYEPEKAGPYAALYRPYAQMARLAYTDPGYLTGSRCPNPDLIADPETAAWARQLQGEHWRCLYGKVGFDNCPRGENCVGGLEYHVWRRTDCTEAVVAFRGSDQGDFGDWISDLRWFILKPYFDQYDQVAYDIKEIVGRMSSAGCRPKRIVATGHSLGGGLAQHAAYASGRIHYVYAFDPSPVTGHLDVPWDERRFTETRFGTDRIYESGEILSLPRYFASGFFPSSRCHPRVRIVRFATIPEPSLIDRHRMAKLTEGLIALEPKPRPSHLPDGYAKARNCTFADG